MSSTVVSPCNGGTIGPTFTLGYPNRPTKTEGGVEPESVFNDNFAEFALRN
jgi:hypothetical protein